MSRNTVRPLSPASSDVMIDYLRGAYERDENKLKGIGEEEFFILAKAEFEFDWNTGSFVIANAQELRQQFVSQFESKPYENSAKLLIGYMNAVARKNFATDSLANLKGQTRVFRADSPAQPIGEPLEYYAYSPFRNMVSDYNFETYVSAFVQGAMIDSYMKSTLVDLEINPDCYKVLPAKLSQNPTKGVFLRDSFITLHGEAYQTSQKIYDAYVQSVPEESRDEVRRDYIEKISACNFDLAQEGITEFKEIPFLTEGGNMVEAQNKSGKKILIVAIADVNFNESGFGGAYFLNNNQIEGYAANSEKGFGKRIVGWGRAQGYDEVVVATRNLPHLNEESRYSIEELYLLDTFLGVANGVLILPEEQVIDDISKQNLITAFEGRVIYLSEAERQEIMANFVAFGPVVFASSKNVSESTAKKFNDQGLTLVVPPFNLQMEEKDGIRCHTQIIPSKGKQLSGASEASKEI